MNIGKRTYWYAKIRFVRLGHTWLIYRNRTPGRTHLASFNMTIVVGKREVTIATHDQDQVL